MLQKPECSLRGQNTRHDGVCWPTSKIYQHPQAKIIPLPGKVINDYDQILDYEKRILEDGFEGVMLRSPLGKYKMGRSTLKEGILLKLKRFEDAEATVVAV